MAEVFNEPRRKGLSVNFVKIQTEAAKVCAPLSLGQRYPFLPKSHFDPKSFRDITWRQTTPHIAHES